MLGSLSEADDALQEAWLRLGRVDTGQVDNLAGWLRTVVTRICLDMLRSRGSRQEDLAGQQVLDRVLDPDQGNNPEDEALLADSVSRALLVVLDTLQPAERIAFVVHDTVAVPFDEIAPIVERTPVATKKLASRARRKVQGTPVVAAAELSRHRQVVSAFLAAARAGDLTAILAVLAPGVVRRTDPPLYRQVQRPNSMALGPWRRGQWPRPQVATRRPGAGQRRSGTRHGSAWPATAGNHLHHQG